MRDDRRKLGVAFATRLLRSQFPALARRPLRAVVPQGWDNATFRLGSALAMRMPTARRYAGQAAVEHAVLPRLAPRLPVAVPTTLALGRPGIGYPFAWTVRRWIPGRMPPPGAGRDPALAEALALALAALRASPVAGAPRPGPANFHRGAAPSVHGDEVAAALGRLGGRGDVAALAAVWSAACAGAWHGAPVWLHGDVAPANLLVDGPGRLVGLIDFGQVAAGDPACDLAIAWSFFEGAARTRFLAASALDPATVARARGWALWKALLVETAASHRPPLTRAPQAILADIVDEQQKGA